MPQEGDLRPCVRSSKQDARTRSRDNSVGLIRDDINRDPFLNHKDREDLEGSEGSIPQRPKSSRYSRPFSLRSLRSWRFTFFLSRCKDSRARVRFVDRTHLTGLLPASMTGDHLHEGGHWLTNVAAQFLHRIFSCWLLWGEQTRIRFNSLDRSARPPYRSEGSSTIKMGTNDGFSNRYRFPLLSTLERHAH